MTIGGIAEPQNTDLKAGNSEDTATVTAIFNYIGAEVSIDSVKRIGKKPAVTQQEAARSDGKPRLILIKMKTMQAKGSVLKNAHKLQDSQWNKISIRPDLTPQQQQEYKNLRAELQSKKDSSTDPKNWRIDFRRWQIVHRPEKDHQ